MHEYLAVVGFFLEDIAIGLQYFTLFIIIHLVSGSLYHHDIWQAFFIFPVVGV
jgi:hypothetical protein